MLRTLLSPFTISEYQALVTGIPKYCPKATFSYAGTIYTVPQAVKVVANVLAAVSAVATAKSAVNDARKEEQEVLAQNAPIVKVIRDNIASLFSNNEATLTAFQIAPKKPRQPLTSAAKMAAAAKAKATREARGTTSKKQKALISGNVTGVTITPITAPVATPAANPPAALSAPATSGPVAPAPIQSPPAAPAAPAPSGSTTPAPIQNPPVAPAPAPAPATAPSPAVTPVVSNPVTPASSGVVTPVPATGTSA